MTAKKIIAAIVAISACAIMFCISAGAENNPSATADTASITAPNVGLTEKPYMKLLSPRALSLIDTDVLRLEDEVFSNQKLHDEIFDFARNNENFEPTDKELAYGLVVGYYQRPVSVSSASLYRAQNITLEMELFRFNRPTEEYDDSLANTIKWYYSEPDTSPALDISKIDPKESVTDVPTLDYTVGVINNLGGRAESNFGHMQYNYDFVSKNYDKILKSAGVDKRKIDDFLSDTKAWKISLLAPKEMRSDDHKTRAETYNADYDLTKPLNKNYYVTDTESTVSDTNNAAPAVTEINGYNRTNAVKYATDNWDKYNSQYAAFSSSGGDCANFGSQCLVAGGAKYTITSAANANTTTADSNDQWYSLETDANKGVQNGTISKSHYSTTYLKNFWNQKTKAGRAYDVQKFTNAKDALATNFGQKGDIVTFTNGTGNPHTAVIIATSPTDYTLAAHSDSINAATTDATTSYYMNKNKWDGFYIYKMTK